MKKFNETYVIGIDHGYGNMKTANCCFPTGVMKTDTEPTFVSDLLVWNKKYYSIGVGHKEFTADKFNDEDYYVLTLAAIARELRRERITEANVFISAGLPLTWVSEQKADFKKYLLANKKVAFTFRGTEYRIKIIGAEIYPQGFAAVAETLGDFNGVNMLCDIGNGTMNLLRMVVTLCTFLAIVIMSQKKIRGAVLIGILGGMGLYYLLGLTVDGFYANFTIQFISPIEAFSEFGTQSLGKVFTDGFDFSAFTAEHGSANLILTIVTTALAFCMVDMFDTLGTLYAACERADLLDEHGEPLNMNRGMLSDAIATTVGAICGTSTVTTFSEVNAGVAAGGRTGLTSIFCGIFFFIAMFLSPIAQFIPGCATAAALIYVGLLMMASVKNIDWDNFKVSVPAFLTLAVMPFTYNISYGIAFGLISYVVISVFCGDIKKIKGSSWVIAALFVAMLLLTH